MSNARHDANREKTLIGVSYVDNETPVNITVDPATGRLLTQTTGGSSTAVYNVNDIEDGVTSYFGKSTADGAYQIVKVTDTSVSYATVLNNGAVTSYTDAWADRLILNYGRFDEAF